MNSKPFPESDPSSTTGELHVRLYVAGVGPNSTAAVSNLKAIRDGNPSVRFNLEVIDLLEDPQRALTDAVYVTPLLLKVSPQPGCRVVGTLSDVRRVCAALGLPGAGE